MSYSVPLYVLRPSHGPNPDRHRPRGRALHCVRMRPPPPHRENFTPPQAQQLPPQDTVARPCHAQCPSTSRERHVGPSRTVAGPKTASCSVPSTSRDVTSAKAERSTAPRPCLALFPFTTLERHVGPSRTVTCPNTVSCSVPVYVPKPSRRPKPNRHLSQDHVVLCSCLRPKTVTSAQAEQSSVPRPCRALFLSTSQDRHVGSSRTVVGPKTVPYSIPVYVPRTLRRPKPNSRRSQDRVVLCFCLRPKTVTSAQAEQSSVPRPCRALFLSTSQDRHVGPSRTVTCPKTMSCSVPVYVPRPSRRPKPNSRRSQDRVVLCSCLRPKTVTSAQAEPSSVPRPCRALFLSTSRERYVGPSRTVVGPKTVPYSIPVYVPRTLRRPKPSSRRSQDRAILYSRLRPENVTSAQAEQSPVPRPCRALFLSTSQDRHVGPSRTVVGPKTVSCSVPVYVPRPSRRPKPNSRRSQDRVVLCSCLRPKNVTSAPSRTVVGPKTVPYSIPVYVPRRHVGPSRTAVGPKTVSCSVPVYVPRPSRRPKPSRRRSQDHVVLCSCLRPANVTSAQTEPSPVPRPCRALFLSTSQNRHVGSSRTAVGPKTVSCSVPVYVPSTSRRPKPNTRRSQDRAILYSRLRPENVTSAQAEQSPVPRPCRALFLSTSQDRHVGPSRTVVGPKTVPYSIPVYVPRTSRRPKPNRHLSQDHVVRCSCLRSENVTSAQAEQSSVPKTVPHSIPVYVPRTSRRPKPNSRRSQDRAMLYSRLRPENVTSAEAEQSPVPRPCHALFPSTSRERHVGPSRAVAGPKTVSCSVSVYVPRTCPAQSPVPRQCLALFPSTTRKRHVGPAEQSPVLRPVLLRFRLRPKNVTSAQAE